MVNREGKEQTIKSNESSETDQPFSIIGARKKGVKSSSWIHFHRSDGVCSRTLTRMVWLYMCNP